MPRNEAGTHTDTRIVLICDPKTAPRVERGLSERRLETVTTVGEPSELRLGEAERRQVTAILWTCDPPLAKPALEDLTARYPEIPIVFLCEQPLIIETIADGSAGDSLYLLREQYPEELPLFLTELASLRRVHWRIADTTGRAFGGELCALWLLDRRRQILRLAAWQGELPVDLPRSVSVDPDPQLEGAMVLDRLPDESVDHTIKRLGLKPAARFARLILLTIRGSDGEVLGLVAVFLHSAEDPTGLLSPDRREVLFELILQKVQAEIEASSQLTRSLRRLEARHLRHAAPNLEVVTDESLTLAMRLTGAMSGQLYLVDSDHQTLSLQRQRGRSPAPPRRRIRVEAAPLSPGPTLDSDPRNLKRGREQATSRTWAQLAIPLSKASRPIGTIFLQGQTRPHFRAEDLTTLSDLLPACVDRLEQAKLFRYIEGVNRRALHHDFHQLTGYIIKAIQDLTGAEVCLWMALRPSDRNRFMRVVAHSEGVKGVFADDALLPIATDTSVSSRALASGEPEIIPDLKSEGRDAGFLFLDEILGRDWRSVVVYPLLSREREHLGVLSLYHKDVSAFDPSTAELLGPFAHQAAIALIQQRQTLALNELARAESLLTENIIDQGRSLLKQVTERVRNLTSADSVVIFPHSAVRQRFFEPNYLVGDGLEQPESTYNRPRIGGLATLVRRAGMVVAADVDAIRKDPTKLRIRDSSIESEDLVPRILTPGFIQREEIKSFVVVSLRTPGASRRGARRIRDVGVLYINFKTPRQLSEEELRIIRIFSNQVATVIHSAWLYIAEKRQASELHTAYLVASRIVAQGDLDRLLEQLIDESRDMLEAQGGKVYLFNHETKKLELVAARRIDPRIYPLGSTLEVGEGLAGRVLEERRPKYINNYRRWRGRVQSLTQLFTGVVGVPLMRGDNAFGVLVVFNNDDSKKFDRRHVDPLVGLARQAALVIHHAQQLEISKRRRRLLQALHETSLAISAPIELEELKKTIVEQAANVVRNQRPRGLGSAIWRCDWDRNRAVIEYSTEQAFQGTELDLDASLMARVVTSKRADFVNDYPNWPECPEPFRTNRKHLKLIKNLIEVPIVQDDRVAYVIAISDAVGKRPFNREDVRLLQRFAEVAAVAISKADLVRQERRLRRQAEIMQQVSTKMISNLTLQEIGDNILEGMAQCLSFDRATVQLVDSENDRRKVVATLGFGGKEPESHFLKISSDPAVRRILEDREPRVVQNKEADWPETVKSGNLATWVGIPVFDKDSTLGLLTLSSDSADTFDEADEDLLRLFANQASVAIQKAKLVEDQQRRIRDLEVLNEVVRVINSKVDVQELFQAVVRQVTEKLGCTHTTLFLKEPGEDGRAHLVPKITWGEGSKRIMDRSFPLDPESEGYKPSLAAWAFTHNQPVMVPDAHSDPRFAAPTQEKSTQRSMLLAPVMLRDRPIGVLSADQDVYGAFDEHNMLLIGALGRHAGLAIDLRLQREAHIDAVKDITAALGQGKKLEIILDLIISWAMTLIGGTRLALIRTVEPESGHLKLRAAKATDERVDLLRVLPRERKPGEGMVGRVAIDREPWIVADVEDETSYIRTIQGIRSALTVPILDEGGKPLGVLNLEHEREYAFDQDELRSVTGLAGLAGIAMWSVRLREELAERREAEIQAFDKVANLIALQAKKGQDKLLNSLTDALMPLMGERNGIVVRLMNGDRSKLKAVAWRADKVASGFREEMPADAGIAGIVAQTGKYVLLRDINDSRDYLPGLKDARSELCVPMIHEGSVIGVVNIENTKLNAFSDKEVKFAHALAKLIVVAIQNAELYTTLERHKNQLEVLYRLGIEVGPKLQLPKVLETIARGANRLLGSDFATIFTYDPTRNAFSDGLRVGRRGPATKKVEMPSMAGRTLKIIKENKLSFPSDRPAGMAIKGRPILGSADLPLTFQDKGFGIIYIDYLNPREFTDDEKRIAELYGQQAAMAIKNAQEFALAKKLAKIEKWAELGKLAGSFAHRLGNRGGIIRLEAQDLSAWIDQLPRQTDDHGKRSATRSTGSIIRNAEYLMEMSHRLLQPTRASEKQLSPSNLRLMIKRALRLAEPEETVEIQLKIPKDLPLVAANSSFIELFLELFTNALTAMKGSAVKRIQIAAKSLNSHVRVSVSDTGAGIPDVEKGQIFSLFYSNRASKKTGHIGYGLWWARTFLRDIGGNVEVESELGKGSTFIVTLPRGKT